MKNRKNRWYVIMALLLFVRMGSAVAAEGWMELTSSDASSMMQLKRSAYESGRPIVLDIGKPLSDCSNCRAAWQHALCDGMHDHESCVPTDDDYGDYPILNWSSRMQVFLAKVSETSLRNQLYYNYERQLGDAMPSDFPVIVLLHVKETADLSSPSLETSQVDVVGAFSFRSGETVNGVTVSSDVPFRDFSRIMDGYFPNLYWNQLDPNASDLIVIESFPTDGTASMNNQQFTADLTERWYQFEGEAGHRYMFGGYYQTGCSAPQTVRYDLYRISGHAPQWLKGLTGDGLDAVDRGFYLDVTESGTYRLKLSASGITGDNHVFRLTVHEEKTPIRGEIGDPYFKGAYAGQWTMDVEAALEAAKSTGKDVVVSCSAVTWCPYCMKMERNFIETEQFRQWAAEHAYLVLIDNRRRLTPSVMDGRLYGASLLCDDDPVSGYLVRNGLSREDGAARLQQNVTTYLEQFLEPVSSMTDAKPTCYPTLIYVRGSDGSMVGRLTNNDGAFTPPRGSAYVVTSARMDQPGEQELFYQFPVLAEDSGECMNNYERYVDAEQLNHACSPMETMVIGGVDSVDWFGFTAGETLERWTLNVKGDGGQVRLDLYEAGEDGWNGVLLETVEGGLSEGVSLVFRGRQTDCRLSVTPVGIPSPVPYQLSWEHVPLFHEVSFESSSWVAKQEDRVLSFPVRMETAVEDHAPVSIAIHVENPDELPLTLETPTLTWTPDERKQGVCKTVELKMNAADCDAWDGSKTIGLSLHVESGACLLSEPSALDISVVSRPFLEGGNHVVMENLVAGVSTGLERIVYCGISGELNVTKVSGPSWLLASIGDGKLWLTALPPSSGAAQTAELNLTVRNGEQTVTVPITVDMEAVQPLENVNPLATEGHSFGGWLNTGDTAQTVIGGRVALSVTEQGIEAEVADAAMTRQLSAASWNGCDASTGAVYAFLWDEDGELYVECSREGAVTGTWMAAETQATVQADILRKTVDYREFAGTYSGFMRPQTDVSKGAGLFGMTIQEDGSMNWSMRFPDGETSGQAVLWHMETGEGRAVITGETDGNGVAGCVLTIVPSSSRSQDGELYSVQPLEHTAVTLLQDSLLQTYSCEGAPVMPGRLTDQPVFSRTPSLYLTLEEMADCVLPNGMELREENDGLLRPEWSDKLRSVAVKSLWSETELHAENEFHWLKGVAECYRDGEPSVILLPVCLAPAIVNGDCCSVDKRSLAEGYYVLPDGRVRRAFLNSTANDYTQPSRAVLDAPQTIYGDDSFGQRILAISGQEIHLCSDGVVPAGSWLLYGLGNNDALTRESLPVLASVREAIVTQRLHAGWNVIGLPDRLQTLSKTSEELWKSLKPMGSEDGRYVAVRSWRAGSAYWIYAPKGGSVSLYGDLKTEDVPKPQDNGMWFFRTVPPVWTEGWFWNGRQFEQTPYGTGGWFR